MFPVVARHNQAKYNRDRKRILDLQTLNECSLFYCNIGVLLEGSFIVCQEFGNGVSKPLQDSILLLH